MTETPQDFDLDAWIDGAERPQRAVTVYAKAGLIADLDRLAEQIQNEDIDESGQIDERAMGERRKSDILRAEYAKLAQQFHDSALTIRVEGRNQQERALAAAGVTDPALKGAAVLADGIQSPKFTPEQVERLAAKIGDAQFQLIVARFNEASEELPAVSADFLPKSSTSDDGGE